MSHTCAVCGHPLAPYLRAVPDPLGHESFDIERCEHCGLGHTLPRPADLGSYYGPVYYGKRHGATVRYCMQRRLRLVAALPGKRPGRLLDIGCGDGSFLLAAKEAGWEVAGTELNPEPARAVGLTVEADIERFHDSPPFDCITMWHTLEHMPDVAYMVRQAGKLLSPDGRLIVAVPDAGGLQAKATGTRWLHLDVPRHLYHFDAGSLAYCLSAAGFATERCWHQEFEYDLLGWSQSLLNHLMRRPNVFFDCLTGKRGGKGKVETGTALLLGFVLSVLALPLVAAGTLSGRGGTLIALARRSR